MFRISLPVCGLGLLDLWSLLLWWMSLEPKKKTNGKFSLVLWQAGSRGLFGDNRRWVSNACCEEPRARCSDLSLVFFLWTLCCAMHAGVHSAIVAIVQQHVCTFIILMWAWAPGLSSLYLLSMIRVQIYLPVTRQSYLVSSNVLSASELSSCPWEKAHWWQSQKGSWLWLWTSRTILRSLGVRMQLFVVSIRSCLFSRCACIVDCTCLAFTAWPKQIIQEQRKNWRVVAERTRAEEENHKIIHPKQKRAQRRV